MKLLTADIRDRLLRNGRLMQQLAGSYAEPDFLPVVQLFLPDGAAPGCSPNSIPTSPTSPSACAIWAGVPRTRFCPDFGARSRVRQAGPAGRARPAFLSD